MSVNTRGFFAALTMSSMLLALPYFSHAQASAPETLSATIRAAILSDPRSANMSEVDIDAMVAALAAEAQAKGVSSNDILWQPAALEAFAADVVETSCENILCKMNEAFGFDGSDFVIPVGLGISSALLLFVIGSLLYHRGHHPVAGTLQSRT
ncbi:hypothetical protein A2853_04025 [Candidatus Kaiserbacteria bacterium RIFCSPHIGHO2_01_FULL_55_17]|uniref:Uncharacterized protein n=1 Tax=Candidatus Kaiserbacteria bacterium RIFCSPHIGHO2_01_FULL_55_17 TaxID=1798484 RepID=A0A1F6D7T7_9BACT|nr:MAG: hypothetical protein A2853_04025 [Candidatus Kaiserbacteria bacterium RIFCSPHIGHO2_01_FULL_55_17]